MSCYAIDFRRDRVAVAADTLAYKVSEELKPLGTITKVFPLPHHRALILGRGMYQVMWEACFAVMQRPDLASIEDLADVLSSYLAEASDAYCARADIDDDWRSLGLLECVMIGWSEREKRFRAYQLNSYSGYHPEADGGSNYGLLAFPNLGPHMPKVSGAFEKTAIEVLKAHRRLFESSPEIKGRVGGEVQLWELTPDRLSQSVIWRFPDTERNKAAGIETARAIMSGQEAINVRAGLTHADDFVRPDDVPERGEKLTRQQRRRLERDREKRARQAGVQ